MINFSKILFRLLLAAVVLEWMLFASCFGESIGQERLAYFELNRVRSVSKTGITYDEYKGSLVSAREYVGLLRDDSSVTVKNLRMAMDYYEQALTVWRLQADSESAVDSLRTDEPSGADILMQCPDISRFHYKNRNQIYVKDAVDCLWRKAADILDKTPAELR